MLSRSGWLLLWVAMSILFVCLSLASAVRNWVTHDEYWHHSIGLHILQTGDFAYDRANPPLVRVLSALPMYLTGVRLEETSVTPDVAVYGDRLFLNAPENYHTRLISGRVVVILMTLVGGLTLAWIADRLAGVWAAVFAFAFWILDPNLLGNGSLVTHDAPVTSMLVVSMAALLWFAEKPSFRTGSLWGFSFGLAMLCKYTAILWGPMAIVSWGLLRLRTTTSSGLNWKKGIAIWGLALAVVVLTIDLGYLFRGAFAPVSSYTFATSELRWLNALPDVVRFLPLPFPRDFLEGYDELRARDFLAQHAIYLDGSWSLQPRSDYYVKCLLYKMPLTTQLLCVVGLVSFLLPFKRDRLLSLMAFSLASVALFVIVSKSSNQLGLRYFLPGYPVLLLLAGLGAAWLIERVGSQGMAHYGVVAVIAGLMLMTPMLERPLSYFNLLAGGPYGGRFHLLDSNLDWGQDLNVVADWKKEHPGETFGILFYGSFPPSFLGIDYRVPPSMFPEPGTYWVSTNFVMGRPHTLRDPNGISDVSGKLVGKTRAVNINEFGYFQFFEPDPNWSTPSMNLYILTKEDCDAYRQAWQSAQQGR